MLSTVKLKAVSLLKLIQSVPSYLVHLLMFVQYVTQLTLKVKSLSSKLSSLTKNVTTLLFLAVQLSNQRTHKSVKSFLLTLLKVKKLKVSLRTLPITVRSLTLVVLTVYYTSQTWRGSVLSTLQKSLMLATKSTLKFLNSTKKRLVYL